MATVTTRTFRSGNSEAVRLPREIAFGEGVELTATRSGDVVTLHPARPSIAEMFRRLDELPLPTVVEERDVSLLPEPPRL